MYPERYQELLDFIDQHPEYLADLRTRLLTRELLELPEKLAALVNTVAELSAAFYAFAEETNRRLENLETLFGVMKGDVDVLKEDVEDLKEGQKRLETDVAALKGNDAERRARENILNIAKDHLDLTRGRILLHKGRDTAPAFLNAIEAAEENGLISPKQADDVLVADIIIRARTAETRTQTYCVFEVSNAIGNGDIDRARERADTVATTTGEPAIAAVIGAAIQPPQEARAQDLNVRVLTPAMLRATQPETE